MKASTRIDATYDGIKNVSIARNTIKKYLYGHVRSSFLRVDFDEAALAVMLPVQQFRKRQHLTNGYFKRRKKNWWI